MKSTFQRSCKGGLRAWLSWGAVVTLPLLSRPVSVARAESVVRFNRDIRPILSENCFACHGPDANKRKAGLRLDTKDGLYEKTPKHDAAVVPRSLEKSELWRRITATDPDDLMPPAESRKALKTEQKELLKQWILDGAHWQGHWAYSRPERPTIPDTSKFKVQ